MPRRAGFEHAATRAAVLERLSALSGLDTRYLTTTSAGETAATPDPTRHPLQDHLYSFLGSWVRTILGPYIDSLGAGRHTPCPAPQRICPAALSPGHGLVLQ